jgi:hypothetical protein
MKKLLDVKNLANCDLGLLRKCRDAIATVDPAAELILYGSRARGDAYLESE